MIFNLSVFGYENNFSFFVADVFVLCFIYSYVQKMSEEKRRPPITETTSLAFWKKRLLKLKWHMRSWQRLSKLTGKILSCDTQQSWHSHRWSKWWDHHLGQFWYMIMNKCPITSCERIHAPFVDNTFVLTRKSDFPQITDCLMTYLIIYSQELSLNCNKNIQYF